LTGGGESVALAIDAMRRGSPVAIGGAAYLAVETADEDALARLDGMGAADLLISGHRAAILKLANQRDGVPVGPVRVERTAWLDLAARSESLRIVSRAKLPTRYAEVAEIVAFRAIANGAEHVALLIGEPKGAPPLVRLHSECLTGDVFGSLKCDCGPQLDDALSAIAASGWGILLYLRQEGRGIGLANKLRAYALQDQGFDTVDANLRIGFGDDERDYAVAARMLEALGQRRVRLLTNNPRKVEGLGAEGVEVSKRVPLRSGLNPHNEAYLETKRLRSGHQL
jgi:GTP cyclohydrolase II